MVITEELAPGALGEIVTLHSKFYAVHLGFGLFFETKVARELADFADRATENDLILIAHDSNGVAASLILDLNDPISEERGAHLRWFISADRCRGTGIGRDFMARAVAHAEGYCEGRMRKRTVSKSKLRNEKDGMRRNLNSEGALKLGNLAYGHQGLDL